MQDFLRIVGKENMIDVIMNGTEYAEIPGRDFKKDLQSFAYSKIPDNWIDITSNGLVVSNKYGQLISADIFDETISFTTSDLFDVGLHAKIVGEFILCCTVYSSLTIIAKEKDDMSFLNYEPGIYDSDILLSEDNKKPDKIEKDIKTSKERFDIL